MPCRRGLPEFRQPGKFGPSSMKGRRVFSLGWFGFVGLLACSPTIQAATVVTHPFVGVKYYHRTETSPRPLVMHILEIDLTAPGISVAVTPDNGAKPGETTRQRTSDFVAQLGAQIGINGTFYTTAGSGPGPGGVTEYYANLTYFHYASGNPVSTWSGTGDPDERGINITSNNVATFIRPFAINQADYLVRPTATVLYNAISSYDGILITNAITATDANLHPRTAMGLNANRTRLYLLVVDGRQTGYSEGMTTIEVAQLLQSDYGVTDAINLDGGGSTTLVMADPVVRVVNRPSDGVERLQGCNFGVFATVPARPSFIANSQQYFADGRFQGALSGTAGAKYEIHVSPDLQNWSLLSVLQMTNSSAQFVDTNATGGLRFYKARPLP